MIASLRGTLLEKTLTGAVIEVGGIGFSVGMSANAIASLPALGETAHVLTYLSVREDDLSLYGFSDTSERELFTKLIGVSGVGPKVALAALSTFPADKLVEVIAAGDVKRVSTVPGVGKKTAQRIVLELKGSIEGGLSAQDNLLDGVTGASLAEATEALLGMGFTSAEAQVALQHYEGDAADVSEVVRYALKRLGSSG